MVDQLPMPIQTFFFSFGNIDYNALVFFLPLDGCFLASSVKLVSFRLCEHSVKVLVHPSPSDIVPTIVDSWCTVFLFPMRWMVEGPGSDTCELLKGYNKFISRYCFI